MKNCENCKIFLNEKPAVTRTIVSHYVAVETHKLSFLYVFSPEHGRGVANGEFTIAAFDAAEEILIYGENLL